MNRLLAFVADELIFLSETVESQFAQTTSVTNSHRLPHGVVFEQKSSNTQADAKRRFGYDPTDTVVVEPGYVSHAKGQDHVLDLASELDEVAFLIAGGARTPEDEVFLKGLEERKPKNVTITGILEDESFHSAFQAADAIVLPYRKGGQSGIFNWCASYEIPVAGSKCDYFCTLKDRYGCLELFELPETEDIERATIRVLSNTDVRQRIIRGLKTFKTAENFEKTAEKHTTIYRNLQR